MKKITKDKHFIKKPIYPGGLSAIRSLVSTHLQYPVEAQQHRIEGTVTLRYTINYKGLISYVKVLKGLGYGCDEEAIRLVKLLKFKVPKTRRVKIQFHKTISIHFKLPIPQTSTVSYNYKSSSKKADQSVKPASYNYSIRIT